MQLFYAPDIQNTCTLPETESAHCVRVLRKQVGDLIDIIDGKSTLYKARIIDAHQKHCGVEILETIPTPNHWNYNITLAIAPTKNMDRIEWVTEKMTEIGINSIIPILCRHSERKDIKTERLIKTAISAMKQSLKATLPYIADMTPIKEIIKQPFDGQRFICYCDDIVPRNLLNNVYNKGGNALILIGPEGDFNEEEVKMALENGFIPITLGNSRLRTETAALVACNTIHILNQ